MTSCREWFSSSFCISGARNLPWYHGRRLASGVQRFAGYRFGTEGAAFDPETVEILAHALDSAYEVLKADSKLAPGGGGVSALAKVILELAKEGERDAERLAERALERFRNARS